jgi:hypothetical protein
MPCWPENQKLDWSGFRLVATVSPLLCGPAAGTESGRVPPRGANSSSRNLHSALARETIAHRGNLRAKTEKFDEPFGV